MNKGIYERYIKRLLDILLSIMLLIILSPLYLIIAIIVRIKLGSPVIFKQQRPGKDGEIFTIYKFRTMTNEVNKNGSFLPDEKRLKKIGKLMRSTSIDELPELINILKGEMSFVGPRPLAISYLEYYTDREKQRHLVSPGLTGLAQINGRNSINWEKRFEFDLDYIANITFLGDFKIIVKTFLVVFKQKDVVLRDTGEVIDFDIYRTKNNRGESK